jgi:hypothetical protein
VNTLQISRFRKSSPLTSKITFKSTRCSFIHIDNWSSPTTVLTVFMYILNKLQKILASSPPVPIWTHCS